MNVEAPQDQPTEGKLAKMGTKFVRNEEGVMVKTAQPRNSEPAKVTPELPNDEYSFQEGGVVNLKTNEFLPEEAIEVRHGHNLKALAMEAWPDEPGVPVDGVETIPLAGSTEATVEEQDTGLVAYMNPMPNKREGSAQEEAGLESLRKNTETVREEGGPVEEEDPNAA